MTTVMYWLFQLNKSYMGGLLTKSVFVEYFLIVILSLIAFY